ncbi:hypothetical protein MKX53_17370 [Psychrobacillus sp. FSL K6-4615]|uniref:hypothetical protein n=1 Tax=Psychrobacillus sp. FSL K6-4615 TaxID=2921551 RepID=UPI0030FAE803
MSNITETNIYEEVEQLAIEKGYELVLLVGEIKEQAAGSHEVDEENKKIKITINNEYKDDLSVGVHELLHAKLFLTGFPKTRTYYHASQTSLNSVGRRALVEIENIAQHTIIYPEIINLGYSQRKLDLVYFEGVKNEIDTVFSGLNKLGRAFRLLECYYRLPEEFATIEKDINEKQNAEYGLFRKMKRLLSKTGTPKEMRKAMGSMIKLVEEVVKKETGSQLYLRYFTTLNPYFNEYQLKQKASKIVSAIKFNEYPDIFLINKEDDICVTFIRGDSISYDRYKNLLEEKTLKEILSM